MTAVGRILPLEEEAPLMLRFVSKEPQTLRIGNFVYYRDAESTDGKVLCRVTARANLESPPETYYASAEHHPGDVLAFTGAPGGILDDYVVHATVLGYKQGPGFRAPRAPPPVGGEVHLAENDYLETCINKVPYEQNGVRAPGGLHIGHVLDRGNSVKVLLDADSVLSTHTAILAQTGQGKSYSTGVVLEELLSAHQRHAVLVVDFHAEYPSMVDAATVLADGAYKPIVDVRTEKTIKIPFGELELEDILGVMPELSDNMIGVMAAAYRTWDQGGALTRQAFLAVLNGMQNNTQFHEASVQAVIRRFIGHIQNRPYFVDGQGEDLRQLVRPGCMTILNLSNLGDHEQEGICGTVLRLMLKARKLTKTGQIGNRTFFELPYPVCLVVEEAHRIAPPDATKSTTKVLSTILSEGRKFGIGTIIVTQRPGKVDPNVLSQCLTTLVGRISNPLDQQNIKQSAEAATADLMDLLPALGRGEMVVFGQAVATPSVVAIRKRLTSVGGDHGSPTKDAIAAHLKAQHSVEAKVGGPPPTQRRDRI
jgi:DNA helicase HerA-like ATPase